MGIEPNQRLQSGDTQAGESETVTANRSHLSTGASLMVTGQVIMGVLLKKSETVPDAVSHEIPRFETEIRYLKERVAFLEADIAERKEREAWLRGQVALPAPERNGWTARLRDWWRNT